MNTHIYCNNCGSIQPLLMNTMDGDDITGQFTDASDLICGTCKLVIATTYAPKNVPSQEHGRE